MATTDAGVADARSDAAIDAPRPPPEFVVESHTHGADTDGLTYALDVPPGPSQILLVSVHLGTHDCASSPPAVTSVTYDGVALTKVTFVVGSGCSTTTDVNRSEVWQLISPVAGAHDIVVTAEAPAVTVHSAGMLFKNVDQTEPVRAFNSAVGDATACTVDLASAPNDLVVNVVGDGCGIVSALTGTPLFIDSTSCNATFDNAAASVSPGANMVTMAWLFANSVDEYQTLSLSLRPN